jgi:hypothetical protein
MKKLLTWLCILCTAFPVYAQVVRPPTGSSGSSLEVKEVDGTPDVTSVRTMVVPNGSLTDNGNGSVTLTISGSGTVTNTGTLTANRLMLGNGANDITASSSLTGLVLGNGASAPTAITTSAGLAGALSDETGSGLAVFATSPTLVTPTLGVASATSINKVTITAPATGSTLTIPDGVTLTGPSSSATVATLGLTNTFTGRQDASGAASTSPMKVGTTAGKPGTCIVGDEYFANDATAGQNIFFCTATNTWTQQLNSGGGGGSPGGSNTQIQYNNSSAFGGAANFTFTSATGVVGLTQKANGNETLTGNRFTDTSPTGNFIHYQNAALNQDLLLGDVTGKFTAVSFATNATGGGTLALNGATSGSVTLNVPATAGSNTMTLPAATDTLIGKATTDTLTNKTYDTAGAGNTFKINGTSITAIKGNTATVATVSGALTTGNVVKSDASGNLIDGGSAGGGFDANDVTVVWFRDDFPSSNTSSSNFFGQLRWQPNAITSCSTGGAGTADQNGVFPHVGITQQTTPVTAGSGCVLHMSTASNGMFGTLFNQGTNSPWTSKTIARICAPSGANTCGGGGAPSRVIFKTGLVDGAASVTTITPAGGCWIRHDTNAGDTDFIGECCSASTCTATTGLTGSAADQGWHTFKISSTTNGQITFTVDTGTPQTVTTNVPTGKDIAPWHGIVAGTGVSGSENRRYQLDFWSFSGTVAR